MFDKHFKCPKSIKMICAGRPKQDWKMFMEAHIAYLQHKRNVQKRKTGTSQDNE